MRAKAFAAQIRGNSNDLQRVGSEMFPRKERLWERVVPRMGRDARISHLLDGMGICTVFRSVIGDDYRRSWELTEAAKEGGADRNLRQTAEAEFERVSSTLTGGMSCRVWMHAWIESL